jgi:ParB-like chromosome segregation protein Spo0J
MPRKRSPKPAAGVRDRVRELRRVRAGDLRPNTRNWRTHPETQRKALRAAIGAIGFADVAICREQPDGGLELLDGHLRAADNPDAIIPVIVVDLDDNEAATLLATLDPLAAMAEADGEKLAALLAEIDTESKELQKLLDEIGEENGLGPLPEGADGREFDESVADDVTMQTCPKCGHVFPV